MEVLGKYRQRDGRCTHLTKSWYHLKFSKLIIPAILTPKNTIWDIFESRKTHFERQNSRNFET